MQTPSERLLANALRTETVTDPGGRSLELRRMTALDRLRLFKAVGPILAQNSPYLGMAMLASSVVSIDGIPVVAPATEPQVEALVAKLGEEGIATVASALSGTVKVASTAPGN